MRASSSIVMATDSTVDEAATGRVTPATSTIASCAGAPVSIQMSAAVDNRFPLEWVAVVEVALEERAILLRAVE